MSETASPRRKPRIAVEGCGHGTLHAIYASVGESCRVKGWDGVDLVIIGGDFQAARNKRDLNVTAMPVKFRRMADFYEYYSGIRKAPYLTVFIGGNHEASNHLFELYYGGWVAPNIYYMGAANILRLGPLRIAGLSGIWKGYDYRKPHFERLPYNNSDKISIFHVRELDVRKMLSVRTQVDIGLSHDWPQGVEWKGDHAWLFRKKDSFEADANDGKLGSVAAKLCLDRLRPAYWFSAHLHIRYTAIVQHEDHRRMGAPGEDHNLPGKTVKKSAAPLPQIPHTEAKKDVGSNAAALRREDGDQSDSLADSHMLSGNGAAAEGPAQLTGDIQGLECASQNRERAQVSAWRNFQDHAGPEEAIESERQVQAQRERAAEAEGTGSRPTQYIFDETWKQVQVKGSERRGVESMSRSTRAPGGDTGISNLDGCNEPKAKRPRSKTPDEMNADTQTLPPLKLRNMSLGQVDGASSPQEALVHKDLVHNTIRDDNEIEIDLSDSASEGADKALETLPSNPSKVIVDGRSTAATPLTTLDDPDTPVQSERMLSEDSDEGGVELDPVSPTAAPRSQPVSQSSPAERGKEGVRPDTVSDVMRARLVELSSSFAPAGTRSTATTSLPFPEDIHNQTTQFLALDKCESNRNFLQLLELEPISGQEQGSREGALALEYDPEWLAILRVFASELEVGGGPNAKMASHKGDSHYRERIIEEERWVEENVVRAGQLTVPANFAITAPVYDADEEVSTIDQPFEYSNPQTRSFCALIGTDNPFDSSQEEREMRMAQGPRPDEERFHRGGRGGQRGGGNRGSRGRGYPGGSSGWSGRSRGRGRGRGRAQW